MDEPRCATCGLVMTPKNSRLRPELFYCDGCLPVMFRPKPAEHSSNTPHVGQSAQLYTELLEANRLLANARSDREILARERNAAEAERDRLRDAARAFLTLLDRHQFSSVALRGRELEALREACE